MVSWLEARQLKGLNLFGASLVFLTCLFLTALAFYAVQHDHQTALHHRYEDISHTSQTMVQKRVNDILAVVQSVAGLFNASEKVTQQEFDRFVDPFLNRYAQAIQALEWVPAVRREEKTLFYANGRLAHPHRQNFGIWQKSAAGVRERVTPRAIYYPVFYVTPYLGNEEAWGFDLGSNPIRRAALEKARDYGVPVTSKRIHLVQEQGNQHGFLITYPVYEGGVIPPTQAQRRAQIKGFVLGVFRVGDFIANALAKRITDDVDHLLEDITEPREATFLTWLINSKPMVEAPRHWSMRDTLLPTSKTERNIVVADRLWRLSSKPKPELFRGTAKLAWVILVMGSLGTMAIALFLASLLRSQGHLRKEKLFSEKLIHTSFDGIVAFDIDCRITVWNPFMESFLHIRQSACLGKKLQSIPWSWNGFDVGEICAEILAGESIYLDDLPYGVDQDKDVRIFDIYGSRLTNAEGMTIGGLLRFHDETRKLKSREQLRQERDLTRRYLEIAGTIILVLDTDFNISLINRKGCEVLGYERNELLGMNWIQQITPADQQEEIHQLRAQLLKGEALSLRYHEDEVVTKQGERRLVAWHNRLMTNDMGEVTGLLASGEDITEKRKVQERLMESEARFRKMASAAQDAIIEVDEMDRILYWNRSAERMFGHQKEQVFGRQMHRLISPARFHPIIDKALAHFRDTGHGNAINRTTELMAIHRDGHEFPVEVSLAAIPHGDDEGHVRWHAVGVVRDLTERKKSEERENYASFQSGVAEMSISILHNIGNAIMSIMHRAETIEVKSDELQQTATLLGRVNDGAKKRLDQGQSADLVLSALLSALQELGDQLSSMAQESFKQHAEKIRTGVGHISEIIQIHQDSSRYIVVSQFNLNELFQDAVIIQSDVLEKYGVKITHRVSQEMQEVHLPRSQMLQMMINLIKNSREAIIEHARYGADYPGLIELTAKPLKQGWMEITISDNGCGITAELLPQIFRFGVSTKSRGTGYGLHSIANFVQSVDGQIVAHSDGPGEGALFTIRLPQVYQLSTEQSGEQPEDLSAGE
uniref:histidine kinase n=1 Tax=Magnetococcus massalia (strain MO-1) TaxID=451514 RepID=A0A1S7LPA8_MAGMO|nr:Protein of unknown function. putative Histidine kinase [Candidatus Magnetococcus massalia]